MNDDVYVKLDRPAFLCWADIETTGLDPVKDDVLELYLVLTTFSSPFLPVDSKASRHFIITGRGHDRMLSGDVHAFVYSMHERSGLRAELDDLDKLSDLATVEKDLLDLSKDWPGVGVDVTKLPDEERRRVTDSKVVIAGNSSHFDLSFLRAHLPRFAARLSHRVFDVSAMSLLARSMGMPRLPKAERHRAKVDVEESMFQAQLISDWLDACPQSFRRRVPMTDDEYAAARKIWYSGRQRRAEYMKTASK